MRARNGWLFPLMVLAAGSVMVFGCIGIAAITGYLPLAKANPTPFSESMTMQGGAPVLLSAPSTQPDHTVVLAGSPAQPNAAPAASDASAKPGTVAKKPGPQ